MAKKENVLIVALACSQCGRQNYYTRKNRQTMRQKLSLRKYCVGPKSAGWGFESSRACQGGGMKFLARIKEYFASVRAEVGRVSWPSRKEVVGFTVLVILMTVVLGVYLGLADWVLQQILRLLLAK